MLRNLLALLLCTFCLSATFSQKIEIDDFQQVNGDVVLKMRIVEATSARERYTIRLSSSFNGGNFEPLTVSRDDVAPGETVLFTLSPSDLRGTGSQLQLRVDIEASVFPLKVNAPSKVKKGKMISASWSGYNTSGPYKVELISGIGESYSLGTENGTSINRQLDENIDKGTYTLRVTPNNSEAFGETNIKIAGGSAILWIAAPVVLGGGAAAYFLLGGETEPVDPEGLPAPPDLPN